MAVSTLNRFSFFNSFQLIHTVYCFYSLYRLWESAASHLLALHQLRHGTSPINYMNIQLYGLNPEAAAKSHGETTYFSVTEPGRNSGARERLVYVMKDRSSEPCECRKDRFCRRFYLSKRMDVLEYAYQAGAAMMAFKQISPKLRAVLMKIGGIIGYMTPILKFHFDPIDLDCFEKDPWLPCMALRTKQPVSSRRLGLLGALKVGLNGRIVAHIKQNPKKFAIGVLQAFAAIGITFRLLNLSKDSSTLKTYALGVAMHTIFFSSV